MEFQRTGIEAEVAPARKSGQVGAWNGTADWIGVFMRTIDTLSPQERAALADLQEGISTVLPGGVNADDAVRFTRARRCRA